MKLTKAEVQEACSTIYTSLLDGQTEDEIMETLSLDVETYADLKRKMLDDRANVLRGQPNDHMYIEYVVEQRRNMKDLDKLVEDLDAKNQYNAKVGAIRLRAEILDRIIEKGQEFGVIKKTAERRELVAGVLIAEMSTEDLKKAISDQVSSTTRLIEKFGDSSILDVKPGGPIHYGKPLLTTGHTVDDDVPVPKDKHVKAKMGKRHAGRKRVR